MKNFGIVFDVDGVLYRDHEPIPGAAEILKKLQELQIPFIFLTNSGGVTEEQKIQLYEKIFENKFDLNQLILAHTPLRSLHNIKHDRTLVIGRDKKTDLQILESYGYNDLVFIEDYIQEHLYLFPYLGKGINPQETEDEKPIKNVVVLGIPHDWLYGGFYKHPRITEGSFRETVCHLYECVNKKKLEFSLTGKPTDLTFCYAKNVLKQYAENFEVKLDRIYMIGDNLESDIIGANSQGNEWVSILVKTGVCKENSKEIQANLICEDVKEAVSTIFSKHELKF